MANNNKNINLKYPPETAGRRMIQNVPLSSPEDKILDVRNMLFTEAKNLESINYIHVVDKDNRLIGIFSLKDIFQKPDETKVKDIMDVKLVKVRPYADQERAAFLSLKYNLKSVPVVDKDNKFLGIVGSDTLLDILYTEDIEDIFRFAGINPSEQIIKSPSRALARERLPWLFLGLIGGLIAAQVVGSFEKFLSEEVFLAFFIPLILYMGSAVGTQTQTLLIRALALDARLPIRKYVFREIKTGFWISVFLAAFLSLASLIWQQIPNIGIILGISLFLTINAAILIGTFMPLILRKFKKDPALGAGPFGTIITDITSLLIYFTVASLMIQVI